MASHAYDVTVDVTVSGYKLLNKYMHTGELLNHTYISLNNDYNVGCLLGVDLFTWNRF